MPKNSPSSERKRRGMWLGLPEAHQKIAGGEASLRAQPLVCRTSEELLDLGTLGALSDANEGRFE